MIDLPDDFRDLLVELHEAGAEFVVLGGHAVAFHGHPRATKDLDVLVRPEPANAARVYRALAAFGAPLESFEVTEKDFATYDGVLQIGLPPRRIDILNRADGTSRMSRRSKRRSSRTRSFDRARTYAAALRRGASRASRASLKRYDLGRPLARRTACSASSASRPATSSPRAWPCRPVRSRGIARRYW